MTDRVCCICGPRIPHHFIMLFEISRRYNYVIQTNRHFGSLCITIPSSAIWDRPTAMLYYVHDSFLQSHPNVKEDAFRYQRGTQWKPMKSTMKSCEKLKFHCVATPKFHCFFIALSIWNHTKLIASEIIFNGQFHCIFIEFHWVCPMKIQ